jgi:hypothetical protein
MVDVHKTSPLHSLRPAVRGLLSGTPEGPGRQQSLDAVSECWRWLIITVATAAARRGWHYHRWAIRMIRDDPLWWLYLWEGENMLYGGDACWQIDHRERR